MCLTKNLQDAIKDISTCKNIPINYKTNLIDIAQKILYLWPKNEDVAMRFANQAIFSDDLRKKAESLSTKNKKVVLNIIYLFECFAFYDIPDL